MQERFIGLLMNSLYRDMQALRCMHRSQLNFCACTSKECISVSTAGVLACGVPRGGLVTMDMDRITHCSRIPETKQCCFKRLRQSIVFQAVDSVSSTTLLHKATTFMKFCLNQFSIKQSCYNLSQASSVFSLCSNSLKFTILDACLQSQPRSKPRDMLLRN